MPELLKVEGLTTCFHGEGEVVRAVDDVSFSIDEGETLGLVGESGSGKSVTCLSILRLLPDSGAEVRGGTVAFLGRSLTTLSHRELRELRGQHIAMIFQEPMTCLNPVLRVGDQVIEAILAHQSIPHADAVDRAAKLFHEVGLPEPRERLSRYPHELSGGQKQRVMIAIALACNPCLLIADEPTTALDVTIQAQILSLLRELRERRRMSMLFITHDLGVIAEIADRVAVMHRGRIVEYGDLVSVFSNPQHPYTKGLLACRPRLNTPYTRLPTIDDFMETRIGPDGDRIVVERPPSTDRRNSLTRARPVREIPPDQAPILGIDNLSVFFPVRSGPFSASHDVVRAVDGVSFDVKAGHTLGLVGESGCGKTTLVKAVLRLVEPTAGRVVFEGREVGALSREELRLVRRRMQIVFQDPYASLNPRLSVEEMLIEPMQAHGIGRNHADRKERAAELLREVGLSPDHLRRVPHEFSGGQRQRICIARALTVEPRLVICDEAVSALDVSVQAQVLNLLKDLQERHGLTYVFISHDLAVVKFMSDTIAVMQDGRIVEQGPAEAMYENPQQEYTKRLIAAIPRDDIDRIRAFQSERARTVSAAATPAHVVRREV